jgi:hypothetical protein
MTRPSSPRAVTIAAACLLPLAAAACAESGASAGRAVVRDSAGIAITESAAPAWTDETALALGREPAVAIGSEEAPEYQLGRITGATRLSDGRIAVFDGMANELRFFDAQGRFVARTGGSGGGPGEYKSVFWMQRLAGDSLALFDISARRVTVLAPDGALARSVSLAAPAPAKQPEADQSGPRVVIPTSGAYRVIGLFADGAMLATVGGAPRIGGPATRDTVPYVRLASDGSLRDTVGAFPGDEVQVRQAGSGQNMMISIGPPPFGKRSRLAVDGDGFWFGSADRYELARYTADGRLVRLVRRPMEPIPVTQDDAEAQKANELEVSLASAPPGAEAALRRMNEERWTDPTLPPTFPAYADLRVDPTGRLWVQETTRPADPTPRWSAFDADGRLLGTISMPESFRALEFGRDYVLGVQRDENDVEQVRLYMLQPGGAPDA